MATNQIRGNTQIIADTITNTEINSAAAIATSKLANGADFIKRDGSVPFTADQSHGGFKITSLGTPTANSDAATKAYVDSLSSGISWKDSVRVATTAAGTLASSFENGDTIDGISLVTGDRILIKDQASALQNGIYTVNASGAPTRAVDADTAVELEAAAIFVEEGTANADTLWVQTADNFTLETDPVVFVKFASVADLVAGAGLTKTGTTLDVGAGDGITVNANDVAVNVSAIAGTNLEDDGSNNLRIAASAAGAGLTGGAASALAVGAGTGITVNANDVAIDATVVQTRASLVFGEVPSGTINGSNVAFTLTANPVNAASTMVYVNGIRQIPTTHYTVATNTITFGTAPSTGDNLLVDFRTA